jgi:hypothetical protein
LLVDIGSSIPEGSRAAASTQRKRYQDGRLVAGTGRLKPFSLCSVKNFPGSASGHCASDGLKNCRLFLQFADDEVATSEQSFYKPLIYMNISENQTTGMKRACM